MIAPVVGRRFSEGSKIMNEQEKDLEKAEQECFETIISMILYLNKNGIRLDAVREMIQVKVEDAFGVNNQQLFESQKKTEFPRKKSSFTSGDPNDLTFSVSKIRSSFKIGLEPDLR